MTERPIIFSGPMVRAILVGRKTVTRRVVKPQPIADESGMWTHESLGGYFAERLFGACFAKLGDSCPYGVPGDRLWLREAWRYADWTEDGEPFIRYRADDAVLLRSGDEKSSDVWATLSDPSNYEIDGKAADRRWRPSIHMPRWASRITLEVVDVRVERLQEISEADAESEGADERPAHGAECDPAKGRFDHWQFRKGFRELWDSINGKFHPWSSNPWVWRVEFKRVEAK